MSPCDFEGCGRGRVAYGLCKSHREQQRREEPLRPLRSDVLFNAEGDKLCFRCGIYKNADAFDKVSPRQGSVDGLRSECKLCRRVRRYSITGADYIALLRSQGSKCAACQDEIEEAAPLGHDHACCPGKGSCGRCIRGILCRGCNSAAGLLGDSPSKAEKLAAYLRRTTKGAI